MTDVASSGLVQTIIGIAGLFVGAISMAVRATYKINDVKADILDKLMKETNDIRQQMIENHDDAMRMYGDSLAAMREKIRDNEIWNRDHFELREDARRNFDSMTTKIDGGFARIEAKLEKLEATRTTKG